MHSSIISVLCLGALLAQAVPMYRNTFAHSHHRQHARASTSPSTPKLVVAHVIVGNTYPYSQSSWEKDIKLAHAHGIDGFALNVGTDNWQPGHVNDAFAAAQESNTGFKLFLSFDMSVLPCSSAGDAATLRNYITQYASHPNQLQVDGKVFATTFSGETCTFGQGSAPAGWASQFTQHPDIVGKLKFAPSFFIEPATFNQYWNVMDGNFNFNSGWPITVTANSPPAVINALHNQTGSTAVDDQYIEALNMMPSSGEHKTYMAAVSPWFSTHYGPNTYNKNWVYDADSHLYPRRWEALVAAREKIDIVQIVTWNDYGESHYIGPIEGALPLNAGDWVNGFDHTAWLDMTAYYAAAFKSGTYPAMKKDTVYLWTRPHAKDANAPDPVPKPTNYELLSDTVWIVVFATAPSTVTASLGGAKMAVDVHAGVTKLSRPIAPGDSVQVTLTRNGATVVNVQPAGFVFSGSPDLYNYNALTAYASSD